LGFGFKFLALRFTIYGLDFGVYGLGFRFSGFTVYSLWFGL
jgi:hypothetical protein